MSSALLTLTNRSECGTKIFNMDEQDGQDETNRHQRSSILCILFIHVKRRTDVDLVRFFCCVPAALWFLLI